MQLRLGGKTAPLADSGAPIDANVTVLKAVEKVLLLCKLFAPRRCHHLVPRPVDIVLTRCSCSGTGRTFSVLKSSALENSIDTTDGHSDQMIHQMITVADESIDTSDDNSS